MPCRRAARVLPSGLNATEQTAPVWPVNALPIRRSVATSHNRAPLSARLPLARVLPSGLNATEPTGPVWPARESPIWRWVATSHSRTRAIVAAGGQGLAVRAERHRVTPAGGAGEAVADLAAGGHIPQPHRVSPAAARILPSGLNATEKTGPLWPARTAFPGRAGAASRAGIATTAPIVIAAAAPIVRRRVRADRFLIAGGQVCGEAVRHGRSSFLPGLRQRARMMVRICGPGLQPGGTGALVASWPP